MDSYATQPAGAHDDPGGRIIPGRQMDYTFASVPEGNIEFVCALPGHFEAGMHTPITVK